MSSPEGSRTGHGAAQRSPNLDVVLKFAALPAVVVYGLLFLAYRNFYTRLGIDPEDAGVDNAYVLSRSTGLVLLVGLFMGLSFLAQASERLIVERAQMRERPVAERDWNIAVLGARFVLSLPFAIFLSLLYSPYLPAIVNIGALFIASAAQTFPIAQLRRRLGEWSDTAVYVGILVVGLLLPATALVSRAHYDADRAMQGCSVEPSQFLSIPILDLSTSHVVVSWTGPSQTRPRVFDANSVIEGTLVARGSGADFILSGPPGPTATVVRIPNATTVGELSNGTEPSACEDSQ